MQNDAKRREIQPYLK